MSGQMSRAIYKMFYNIYMWFKRKIWKKDEPKINYIEPVD